MHRLRHSSSSFLSRRAFLFGAGIVSVLPPAPAPLDARERPDVGINAMRRRIPSLLELHGVPGLSLAMIEHGRVLWAEGFGSTALRDGHRVSTTTVFGAASLSKPLFAYVVLKLAELGAIDVDDTVRALLSHSSGDERTPAGTFAYSPSGYMRLQGIIERRMGALAPVILNRRLFAPLDLDRTRLGAPWESGADLAAGHVKAGPLRRTMGLGVSSGVYTTAADYARFLLAIRLVAVGSVPAVGCGRQRDADAPRHGRTRAPVGTRLGRCACRGRKRDLALG
jgi:CubicO group peptidase (beta-lactamase class C family)